MNREVFKLWGLIALILAAIAILSPINFGWIWLYELLQNQLLTVLLNLIRISLLAFTFAGLLAPFEALGWWAGWYGNDTRQPALLDLEATNYTQSQSQSQINHYIVYLDGIGKSSFDYSFRVERFLTRLAESLPGDRLLIRDIMPYSVLNLPLTIGRPLARFWEWIDRNKIKELGVLILLRNMFQVAVSVDRRYGQIYNRGVAQAIIKSLLDCDYHPRSGIPITLIGYSGGGQISLGATPYLKKALAAPIEVISLAGVLSGNTEVVQLEHLYHLVGQKDRVARFTFYLFPQRWPIISWSSWNLAKSRGEISFISLGKVGHDSAGGPLDDRAILSDGRTHLDQTLDIVTRILTRSDGKEPFPTHRPLRSPPRIRVPSNYERYLQAPFNQYSYYPIQQSRSNHYRPVASWMGRLILPEIEQRSQVQGVYFEVYHAPAKYQHLVDKTVCLRWSDKSDLRAYVSQVKTSIHFSAQAYESINKGKVHPLRLNYWRGVDPLESLAGARPYDDVIVMLGRSTTVTQTESGLDNQTSRAILSIDQEPVIITGRFYGLVTILGQAERSNLFRVRHFNPCSHEFDGDEETVYIPQVVADRNGVFPFTTHQIDQSPLNATGWYIYGAKNHDHIFTVRAIAPRALFQLQPNRIITGKSKTIRYIHHLYWRGTVEDKGKINSILLHRKGLSAKAAIEQYQEGDRLLVLHTFGGIGGEKREFAPLNIFFGHFAFGFAKVVREPLTQELRFRITYSQVYTQNSQGIIAANLDWTNYMGDRQSGWLGSRPVVDIIVKLDLFEEYDFGGVVRFPLSALVYQLDKMMARYRTGDGTGATFVGPANSCVQDSCQALYQAVKITLAEINRNQEIQAWLNDHPEHPQTKRLQRLIDLNRTLEGRLISWQTARADWLDPYESLLGTRLADQPITTIANALTSWRSLLPRLANDSLAEILLRYGASLWLLRTNQVGGWDGSIEPIAPTKIWI